MTDLALYASLFLTALVAGSILPVQSEAALAGLLVSTSLSPVALVAVASLGNILGSVLNWLMGRGIERFSDRRWFPVSAASLERATSWYHRWGRWSLLASWVPIIGDPLTVVAGVLREPLGGFILLVAIAKTLRYVVVAAIAMNAF